MKLCSKANENRERGEVQQRLLCPNNTAGDVCFGSLCRVPKIRRISTEIGLLFGDTCDFWKFLYLRSGFTNGRSSTDLFVNEAGFFGLKISESHYFCAIPQWTTPSFINDPTLCKNGTRNWWWPSSPTCSLAKSTILRFWILAADLVTFSSISCFQSCLETSVKSLALTSQRKWFSMRATTTRASSWRFSELTLKATFFHRNKKSPQPGVRLNRRVSISSHLSTACIGYKTKGT